MRSVFAFLFLFISQHSFSQFCEEWGKADREAIRRNHITNVRIYTHNKALKNKTLTGTASFYKNACLQQTLTLNDNPNSSHTWLRNDFSIDSIRNIFTKQLFLGDTITGWIQLEKREFIYSPHGKLYEHREEILNGDFLDVYTTRIDPLTGNFNQKTWVRFLNRDTLFIRTEWKNAATAGHLLMEKHENTWKEKERSETIFSEKGELLEYRLFNDGKLRQEYLAPKKENDISRKDPYGYREPDENGLPSPEPFTYDTTKIEIRSEYGLKALPKKKSQKQYYTLIREFDQISGSSRAIRILIFSPGGLLLIEDHVLGDYYLEYKYF